ncbi:MULTISPECIES: amidohydrolase family protein [Bacillaceae]|uniref:Amidohydrolase family protein n=1 Tax=Evansella alkalicola TaxID=745819 RepID=A0ABS6JUJ6_9BACI|nr:MULTISPECIES: amidohydrolase family protein [Bacillaceae]MBU9720912.1 amidohydrolase family protein [Bacillus alkalicola]
MSFKNFQLKHVVLLIIPLVLLFVIISTVFMNDSATEEVPSEQGVGEKESVVDEQDYNPLIDSGFEEKLTYSTNEVVQLAVNSDLIALLFLNENNEQLELAVGSITYGMEDVLLLDGFPVEERDTFSLAWVPDSTSLMVSYKDGDAWQLVTYDVTTEEEEVIHTFDEPISNIAFSHVQDHIYYSQPLPSNPEISTIRINNWSFDAPLDIFQIDSGNKVEEFSVAPDQNKLAYILSVGNNEQELWIYDTTVNEHSLTASESKVAQPSWSKDGNLLAFSIGSHEGQVINVMNVHNEDQWTITNDRGYSTSPSWTKDDNLIFSTKVQEEFQIFELDMEKTYGSKLANEESPNSENIYEEFDAVILNGIVVDPETETFKFGYNVGIKDKKIAAITRDAIEGIDTIDATGKLVTPGFIDILSFNPNGQGEHFKVMDGVTTHLGMHGAGIEFRTMFNNLEGAMINHFGGAIQHSHMRTRLGIGSYEPATDAQIEQMREMTHRAAQEGAIGISLSPEYYPGMTPEEIKAVMEVGKEYDLVSFFHVRYSTMYGEGGNNFDALEEVIGYARELDVPVQVQHINSTGGTFSMEESLAMIDEARAEGLDITIDMYPYNYWATWANTARFSEGFRERFQLDYSDLQVANSEERLTADTFAQYRRQRILLIAYGIPEEDVRLAMMPDYAMVGSDTIMVPPDFNNHPRGSGTFSRMYRKYVKETETIPFMKALRMMTNLPVERLENVAESLQTKGRFQVGMDADINIINYEEIRDTAGPENVASFSEGIDYVFVDGTIVKDLNGIRKNIFPGQVIRSHFE